MIKSEILDAFLEVLQDLADEGKAELAAQGHKASGRGINSVEPDITKADLERLVGVIYANDYLVPVDTGVTASRIPFGGSGRGNTSKYIQGLLDWVSIIKPSLGDQESLSFVFAIANTQAKEGNPTRGSFIFSSNGRRTGWIESGIGDKADDVERFEKLLRLIPESYNTAIAEAARAA